MHHQDRTQQVHECIQKLLKSKKLSQQILADENIVDQVEPSTAESGITKRTLTKPSINPKEYRNETMKEALKMSQLLAECRLLLIQSRKKQAQEQLKRQLSSIGRNETSSKDLELNIQQAQGFIKMCNQGVQVLEQRIRIEIAKASESVRQHWDGILWILNWKLSLLMEMQRIIQENHDERIKNQFGVPALDPDLNQLPADFSKQLQMAKTVQDVSTSRSDFLEASSNQVETHPHLDITSGASSPPPVRQQEQQQQQQQQQVLQQENEDLLKDLMGMEEQIKITERSVLEISELQQQLTAHLIQQQDQIQQIYGDAQSATGNITKGNENLTGGVLRHGVFGRQLLLLYFLVMTGVLWFLHWYED